MSERTLTLLLIFFLVSAGLYFYLQHQGPAGAKSTLVRLGQKEWQKASVIEIRYQNQGFRLVKEGGRWLVEDGFPRPAKEDLVTSLLKELSDLYGEPRAKGKKYFSRFKVDRKNALEIVLKEGDRVLATILVGKRGPQWESSFVRLASKEEIYLVPVNLLAKFEIWADNPVAPEAKVFVDHTVLDLKAKDLKRLVFQDEISWELEKKKEGFLFTQGDKSRKLSLEETETFLRKVFPLIAEELVPPQKFSKPKARLVYETSFTTSGEILLGPCEPVSGQKKGQKGKKRPEKSWCLVKKGEFVYRIKEEKLKPLWEPAFEPEK